MEYHNYFSNYFISTRILLFAIDIKMTKYINKKLLLIILIFISLILIFAFLIEYKLGKQPCKLCIYERIPYFLSILLLFKILLFKKNEKITLLILSLVFISSSASSPEAHQFLNILIGISKKIKIINIGINILFTP